MSVDTDLVASISAALGMTRVYHFKVFQDMNPDGQFPCVVYQMENDTPIEELDGNSGMWTAVFVVYILTRDDDILRQWAGILSGLSGAYLANGWTQWTGDVEQYEIPTELEELGVSITQLNATITREGK